MSKDGYVILCDSSCDIDDKTLNEWQVSAVKMNFCINDSEAYKSGDIPVAELYRMMKKGKSIKTSSINCAEYEDVFRLYLDKGKDILYLGFSSGLSCTYNSAILSAEKLKEEYTDRKIIAVDTLSASAGYGLLIYLTVCEKQKGADIETAALFAEKTKLKICHWFTVDDLTYLKKGGRINPALAFVGNALGFKPVMHMDNGGHLVNINRVRGRKNALAALCDKYGELAEDKNNGTVFISEGDSKTDAATLSAMLYKQFGVKVKLVSEIGAVIGAHSGPGTLALFFIGKER